MAKQKSGRHFDAEFHESWNTTLGHSEDEPQKKNNLQCQCFYISNYWTLKKSHDRGSPYRSHDLVSSECQMPYQYRTWQKSTFCSFCAKSLNVKNTTAAKAMVWSQPPDSPLAGAAATWLAWAHRMQTMFPDAQYGHILYCRKCLMIRNVEKKEMETHNARPGCRFWISTSLFYEFWRFIFTIKAIAFKKTETPVARNSITLRS